MTSTIELAQLLRLFSTFKLSWSVVAQVNVNVGSMKSSALAPVGEGVMMFLCQG